MTLSNGSLTRLEPYNVLGHIVNLGLICCLGFMLSIFAGTGCARTEAGVGEERLAVKDDLGKVINLYQESHALLIGISDYSAGWSKRENIPQELNMLEGILKHQGYNVVKYLNLTANQLRQVFEEFIDTHGYDPDNRLLFYFAGHGYTRGRGSKGYLVPADAPLPMRDEIGFLRKALSMPQILAWSRSLESRHVMFLFDSCFSASVFKSKSLTVPAAPINQLTAEPVRAYITSCRAGEQVPQQSAFAQVIVDALRYGVGDLNADGYVTGMELGAFLQKEVPKHGPQTPHFSECLDYKLSRGDFVFVIRPAYAFTTKKQGRLWVKTHPPEASVRILNIKSKYTPGIALAPQRYHIEVSNPGYHKETKWISLAEGEDKYITVRLRSADGESSVSVALTVAGGIQIEDHLVEQGRCGKADIPCLVR